MPAFSAKALLWDLDGTIIDSLGIFIKVFTESAAPDGHIVPPRHIVNSHFHGTLEEIFELLLQEATAEQRTKVLERFIELQDPTYKVLPHDIVFPDALQLMKQAKAKGLTQGIVTKRGHRKQGNASPRVITTKPPLNDMFSAIMCGDDEFHKPDRRVLDQFVTDFGIEPKDIVIIGDQAVDGQLAINAGAKAILVKREGVISHLEKLGDDWQTHVTVVSDLSEVSLS